jgi:hypothetical protein
LSKFRNIPESEHPGTSVITRNITQNDVTTVRVNHAKSFSPGTSYIPSCGTTNTPSYRSTNRKAGGQLLYSKHSHGELISPGACLVLGVIRGRRTSNSRFLRAYCSCVPPATTKPQRPAPRPKVGGFPTGGFSQWQRGTVRPAAPDQNKKIV